MPSADPCPHDWELRPLASSNTTQRYECTVCHRWAFRMWTRSKDKSKRRGPLKIYNPPRLTPDPLWLADDRPNERDEKERGKSQSGNRMVLDPERLRGQA